jgi:hypothetical protein
MFTKQSYDNKVNVPEQPDKQCLEVTIANFW